MKLSKEKRDRLVLVVILTVAVGVGVWQILIQTTMARLATTRGMAASAKKKFEQAEAVLKQAPLMEQEVQVFSNQLARIEAQMADPVDTYSWSYQMIMQATNHAQVRLEIKEVTRPLAPGPVQLLPEFPYEAVTFELRGRAFYEEFGKFLADFENDHPYLRTQSIELKPAHEVVGEEGGGGGKAASAPVEDESAERLSFRLEVVALVRPGS